MRPTEKKRRNYSTTTFTFTCWTSHISRFLHQLSNFATKHKFDAKLYFLIYPSPKAPLTPANGQQFKLLYIFTFAENRNILRPLCCNIFDTKLFRLFNPVILHVYRSTGPRKLLPTQNVATLLRIRRHSNRPTFPWMMNLLVETTE